MYAEEMTFGAVCNGLQESKPAIIYQIQDVSGFWPISVITMFFVSSTLISSHLISIRCRAAGFLFKNLHNTPWAPPKREGSTGGGCLNPQPSPPTSGQTRFSRRRTPQKPYVANVDLESCAWGRDKAWDGHDDDADSPGIQRSGR